MNFIDRRIQQIKKEQRPGIMTHVVAGYPNFEGTRELVLMMAAEGVDFVELQIPFSDPLGDGAVIRRANTAAIDNGFRVRDGFRLVKVLKQEDKIETPLLFMTYFNIVFNYGVEKFCRDAKDAGVRGLIVPDYTDEAEEHDHLRRYAREYDLHLIDFLALDSGAAAMTAVEKRARGFVYCFSRRGVTGAREDLLQELGSHLAGIKERVSCPLGVGFGISSGEQVRQLKGKADIVIVGSAILKAYN
ncbi:MAG: tryptophan synthase subunit alpha, partial [Patescibacteria group bacterium]